MAPICDGVMKHQAWLGQLLNDDRHAADSTCNLVLESEGKQFKVHKSVLMLVSNYFRRMFTIEMKEKYEVIIKMQNIPHQRLANIIQFIYSGKIEITEENILDILDDAEYTEIEVLKAKCSAFLLNVISADNCLKLRAYAQRYNLDDLITKANHFIVENFETVVQSEDLKQLEFGDLSSILENRIKNCEEAVFTGIVEWVHHNPLQRNKLFLKLFSTLDLSLMTADFLNKVYEQNLVKSNNYCLKLLTQASLEMNTKLKGEKQSREFLVIGGEDTEQDCVVYHVTTKQSRQLPKLQLPRCGALSAQVGKKVYAIGGAAVHNSTNPYKSGEMLDLNEQTGWIAIPDMGEARSYGGSALIEDFIYVTGGYDGKTLSSCEKYDIHNKKWSNISNLVCARYGHGMVVCNGLIYCIGGWGDSKRLSSCELYNMQSGVWNEIAPLIQARSHLTSVVLDGKIYAIGGWSDDLLLKTCEQYDPKSKKWQLVASLNIARSMPSACVVGNKIFVIGGWDGKNNLESVEVYDPILDVWTIAFKTQKKIFAATIVAI
uniref:Kelch-like protein 20 n=1 Tax=Phallusia mammillata TaxID=59560 RepID=A0A6F9DG87_9ASCI|nr:kelch-like protein 20 [Phallusia mammillata]